jgi:hypothetical protein
MKRIAEVGWMEGMTRLSWSKLEEVVSAVLGGMKTPVSRKDLMFDMRRRELAEGDRRMMGSRRRGGFFCRLETSGACDGAEGMLGLGRERRKPAAILRYDEKSLKDRSTSVQERGF